MSDLRMQYQIVLEVINSEGEVSEREIPFPNHVFLDSFIEAHNDCKNEQTKAIHRDRVLTDCYLPRYAED